MSLMEDLRSQLADKRAAEDASREEQQAQEDFYTSNLRPVMVQAREYFDEIVASVNEIAPDIECRYPLNPDSKQLVSFSQSNLEFFYDDVRNPRKIHINCTCSLKAAAEFFVSTEERVEQYADLLTSHGITFHQKNRLDNSYNIRAATFILDELMPASIAIQSHPVDRCIYVYLRNFTSEALKRHRFSPDQLTPELFDKIARILLRKETELVQVSISTHAREKLKNQVQSEQQAKEKEIAEGLAYLESLRLAEEEEAKLLNRAKKAVLTRTKDMAAIVSSLRSDRRKSE